MGSVLGSLGGGGGLGALLGQAQQGAGGGGGGGFSDIIGRAFGGLGNRTPLLNPRPPMGTMGPQAQGSFAGMADRFGTMMDQNQWRPQQWGGQPGMPTSPKGVGNQTPVIPPSPISNAYGTRKPHRMPTMGSSPWEA